MNLHPTLLVCDYATSWVLQSNVIQLDVRGKRLVLLVDSAAAV